MAHTSSTRSNRRLDKPEASPAPDERWRTSPSTEVTSDEGENAGEERRRKSEENVAARPAPPRRSEGARRRP